jgi:hypothetical protein
MPCEPAASVSDALHDLGDPVGAGQPHPRPTVVFLAAKSRG